MTTTPDARDELITDELTAERLRKLDDARAAGVDPYPAHVDRSHTAAEAHALYAALEADGQTEPPEVAVAGRLLSIRPHGKLTFATIQDGSGPIQLAFKRDTVGADRYAFFQQTFDRADFISARGPLFRTRMGELTVEVREFAMLAKALRPLPEKWHGLQDTEARYRQRYLDILTNPDSRAVFLRRTAIVSAMRRYLDGQGFLEVETPVLQPLYGGAAARPFETYYNALERTFFLRISDELYLKRLIVGGLDKVYEIGRDFRNEGVDTTHNPEFTMMECYWAYADYRDIMALVENMTAYIAQQVMGTTRITYQGHDIELAPPWQRVSLRDGILAESGIDIDEHTTFEALRDAIRAQGVKINPKPTWGQLVNELLDACLQPTLIQPTFVIDYPTEISPLAKKKPDAPQLTERFEFFIATKEMGNAFSELNDPLDQRERFVQQAAMRAAGDEETMPLDEDYILALMHGMPPTAGLGVGIDRLTMLLADRPSIREVILFPQLRTLK